MAKGFKTGGRVAGTPNKSSVLQAVLKELDPTGGKSYWQQVHAIATGQHDDVHARLKALTLMLAYIEGKPVDRQEHTGPGGGPIPYTWQQ